MKKPFVVFAGLLAAGALLGQGCVVGQRTDLRMEKEGGAEKMERAESSEAKVDAAVEAILDDAEAEAEAEGDASAEMDIYESNGAELDAYAKTEYEIK